MTSLTVRGVDETTLSRIRSNARRRKVSVNRLIVETLQERFRATPGTFGDLDALAGTWSADEAAEFDAAVAQFGRIDPESWVAEPRAAYQARKAPIKVAIKAGRKKPGRA